MLFFVALTKKKWSSSRKTNSKRNSIFKYPSLLLLPFSPLWGLQQKEPPCRLMRDSHCEPFKSTPRDEQTKHSIHSPRVALQYQALCWSLPHFVVELKIQSDREQHTKSLQNVSWHISLTKLHKNKSLVQKNVCLPTRASHSNTLHAEKMYADPLSLPSSPLSWCPDHDSVFMYCQAISKSIISFSIIGHKFGLLWPVVCGYIQQRCILIHCCCCMFLVLQL